MIRSLWLILSLSVASTAILTDNTFAATTERPPKSLQLTQVEPETPLCYLQTSDGKVLNLNQLCQQQPKETTASSTPQVKSPYNPANIKKFDDDLYGEGK